MVLLIYLPLIALPLAVSLGFILLIHRLFPTFRFTRPSPTISTPISVNYHFTRVCNKTCKFCFFTHKTSHKMSSPDAFHGLSLLAAAGMKKINFAGGEPFLYQAFLGEMIQYCKETLHLESVSIVTNGSLVAEKWLAQYGQYVDIIAVSCDSFNQAVNEEIGRGGGDNVKSLFEIAAWCKKYGIKFKLNTVVCRLNYQEDMNAIVSELQPFRWKCFQVLIVKGENDTEKTLRDARQLQISKEQYAEFCKRHEAQSCFVPESNELMARSYLILDEYMRFLDRDGKEPSKPILEIGVQKALAAVYWDQEGFVKRGGVYDWSRNQGTGEAAGGGGNGEHKELEF
ncbi:hypothetical protein MMC30_005230 [Trapelia coarctata]|nr:hypothetical protein [Trapelia coarctata]